MQTCRQFGGVGLIEFDINAAHMDRWLLTSWGAIYVNVIIVSNRVARVEPDDPLADLRPRCYR